MLAFSFSQASMRGFLGLVSLSFVLTTQAAEETNAPANNILAPTNAPALTAAELAIKNFQLAEGFKAEVFAAEPLLANPVSFTFDEKGRAYVAETFRVHDGVFDIRKHMHWLDEELAARTLDDHLAKIEKHRSEVPDMTRRSERIRLIADTDGDGKADHSTIFAEGFTNSADGIAAGVLARQGDVYFTCIPDLYLLRDDDGDGRAEKKKSLQTGYAVRFGFLGHDLHGLIVGPDGKLYFSIGDRGFSVKQGERTIAFPEGGAVLRCDLDGSNLEIFAQGHRNPQELAFDQYGNLFTGDNNSDAGDQARWVYLVEGGDSGWRIGWQFIQEPNPRGPWNADKMWDPEKARHVGYIVPPVANIASGPAGLAYYPGVGLSEKFNDHFLLCDFRGSPNQSKIHSFANQPKGASFAVVDHGVLISNVLATDIAFAPDGMPYVLDWVKHWDMADEGRLYKIVNAASASPLVDETKKLINEGMGQRSSDELATLLAHPDQRVRQEAQFALAAKGQTSIQTLLAVAKKNTNQLARIHAIWGIGQISNSKLKISDAQKASALSPLVKLLADSDAEVSAQAAKTLGESRFAPAYDGLLALLQNGKSPRGQFFAAGALGKLGRKAAAQGIMEMLRGNDDQDAYLRHAGVMALVWLNDFDSILAAAKNDSAAVRLASAVAMRRLERPEVAMLLHDQALNVAVEAARAINDLPIVAALPELAKLIGQTNYDEALCRRVLNANFRVGAAENAAALAQFAARSEAPAAFRVEALELLAQWARPSRRDHITGLWRPLAERAGQAAAHAVRPLLAEIMKSSSPAVQRAAIHFAQVFAIKESAPLLFALVADKTAAADVRAQALQTLAQFKDDQLVEAVDIAAQDTDEVLRKEAIAVRTRLAPADATGPLVKILDTGTTGEKQSALAALGALSGAAGEKILGDWMDKLIAGEVAEELRLDLLEAAAQRSSEELKKKIESFDALRPKDDLELYCECLAGGNAEAGRKIFLERIEASCIRCHKAGAEGGEIGPALDGIGGKKTREYLLRSLVNPNAEVAEGFESVLVTLKNGQAYAGTLKSETKKNLVINSPEDGPVTVAKKDIAKRERGLSGMPPELVKVLSKQDLRNLVEFLANLR